MNSSLTRETAISGCLLALSIAVAWWAQRPSDSDADNPFTVVSVAPANVDTLTFRTAQSTLTASRLPLTPERFILRVERAGAKPEEYIAGDAFPLVLKGLAPFQALRAVAGSQLTPEESAEFGLSPDVRDTLTIQPIGGDSAKRLELQIGRSSYGTTNAFVREWSDGRVLLANGALFEILRRPEDRLVERRLFSIAFEAAKQLLIRGDSGPIELTAKAGAAEAQIWSWEGATAEKTAVASTLVDRVARLRLISLANAEDEARLQSSSANSQLEVTAYGGRGESETVRIVQDAQGTWAHGSYLKRWAKVSQNRVDPILTDYRKLVN